MSSKGLKRLSYLPHGGAESPPRNDTANYGVFLPLTHGFFYYLTFIIMGLQIFGEKTNLKFFQIFKTEPKYPPINPIFLLKNQ